MTERAKRAVEALKKLGWDCSDDSTKSCQKCDYPVAREWKYCPQCGAEAHPYPAQESVDDLEIAIAAALEDPWRWAVREVGLDAIWRAAITLEEALSAATAWEADGIEHVEVVPLFAGPAVQR